MFVGILLRDPARDFGVEFESLRHREIFEISARGQKTIGSHLKFFSKQSPKSKPPQFYNVSLLNKLL